MGDKQEWHLIHQRGVQLAGVIESMYAFGQFLISAEVADPIDDNQETRLT